jgi:drug/metabolite transporter, DME family
MIDSRRQSGRGLPFLVLAATLWGTVPVATNAIYQQAQTNALSLGFLRLALSLLILVPTAVFVTKPRHWRLPWRDLALLLLFGASMALYQVCYFAAIPRIGVTTAALVTLCTAPLMVAILGRFFLGERLSFRVYMAMLLAISGVLMLIGMDAFIDASSIVPGVLLALGAAFGFAVVALSTRALTGRYHSLQLIAIGMAAGALILLPFALFNGLVLQYPPTAWLLLMHLGLAPTALGYIFFFYGLRFTQAAVASTINLLEPLTSALLAWLIFDERLGLTALLGAMALLLAMALLYWQPARHDAA